MSRQVKAVAALTILGTVFGCAPRLPSTFDPSIALVPPRLLATSEEIYGRASNSFPTAVFFKPAGGSDADLTFRLAPLILQEVQDNDPTSRLQPDSIGSLAPADGDEDATDSQPTVYTQTDTVAIHGRDHLRLTYLWCYAEVASPSAPGIQGIRITLNTAGEPSIWEILADTSAAALIFVSESVESAARVQYGSPLPGRRFAVETSRSQAPNVVVARVIADGPTPMGPLVYLRAGTRSVGTLTCRCMPAQAKRLLETRVYRLAPVQRFLEDPAWVKVWSKEYSRFAFQPERGSDRIERRLRLASGY